MPEFMPTEAGFILFISDVSARLNEIKTAVQRGLLATVSAMGAAEKRVVRWGANRTRRLLKCRSTAYSRDREQL